MKRLFICFAFLFLSAFGANAASRFAICATTCTWDGASTAMWSASSGGATGASVPGVADTVTLDANTCTGGTTCTITVNTTVTIVSLTMGACTGTTTGCILDFSVNNNNVNISGTGFGLALSGTGTRTLKMGSGTWSFTNSGTVLDLSIATNFTLTPNTSTIKFTGGNTLSRVFQTAASTWANFILDGGEVTFAQVAIVFTNITLNGPSQLFVSHNQTMTATSITSNGSAAKQNFIATNQLQSGANGTISIVSGTQTLNWAGIAGITFSGGATFIANNSFKLGPNTGITINAPSAFASGGSCILGGWLLWRDFDPTKLNDNFPAFLEKAS